MAAESIPMSLRRAKLRPTRARIMVLDAFHRAPKNLQSRSEIVAHVLTHAVPLNISTIYGTILDLERHGFLSRTWTRDRKSVYCLSNSLAANIQLECSCCSRTWPLDDEDLLSSLLHMSKVRGVALSPRPTRIQIVCAECQGEPDDLMN